MRTIRRMVAAIATLVLVLSVVAGPLARAATVGAKSLSAPVFKSKATLTVDVGKKFKFTARTKADPVATVEATNSLPSGVSLVALSHGRATLSGTIAQVGTDVIDLKATNSQGSVTQDLTVTVKGHGGTYCGTMSGSPTTDKFMVIYEENHDYSAIIGSRSAPNINAYAQGCGLATDYQSLTHPSLPNYLASTSGVSYALTPWNTDCDPTSASCTTGNSNIFNQVGSSGWKGYAESMTTNCQTASSGTYATKHNPAPYYTDVAATCATNDVPLGTITSGNLHNDVANGTLPAFSTVTPNLNDDMHDGTIRQADKWLGNWIPVITGGPDYRSGHLVIIIVWDEGSGSGNSSSTVPMIALSPFVAPGTKSNVSFTHYSLLKAAESVAGVPALGSAGTANNLRSAFGF